MPNQAKVSSIDALEAFRADLIQYIEKARVALEDMSGEVRRTRTWLDVDRAQHWGREMKGRIKHLEQAEQELYSANLTNPKASNALQKMAVTRAERQVKEAEEKLRLLKYWRRHFDQRAGSLVKQLDPMLSRVGQQLPRGVVFLTEAIKALQTYAEARPTPAATPPVETEAAP